MGNKQAKKTSTELKEKDIASLQANTNYTEKEIRQWHAGFIRDCPNGLLNKKQFIEVYQRFYPQGKVDSFCKFAFAAFDRNHNGTIDFEEFLLSISATTSQCTVDERLETTFNMYDLSHDGLIDQKEMAGMISAMYDLVGETDREGDKDPKKRAADIIAKLDVNGDKKLTKEEFVNGCKNDAVVCRLLAPAALL